MCLKVVYLLIFVPDPIAYVCMAVPFQHILIRLLGFMSCFVIILCLVEWASALLCSVLLFASVHGSVSFFPSLLYFPFYFVEPTFLVNFSLPLQSFQFSLKKQNFRLSH